MANTQKQSQKAIELKLPTKEMEAGDCISKGFNLEGTEMTIYRAAKGSLADRLQDIANSFGNTLTLIEAEVEIIEPHWPQRQTPKSRAEKATLRKLNMVLKLAASGMFGLEEFILTRFDEEEGVSAEYYRRGDQGEWVRLTKN